MWENLSSFLSNLLEKISGKRMNFFAHYNDVKEGPHFKFFTRIKDKNKFNVFITLLKNDKAIVDVTMHDGSDSSKR